MLGTCFVKCVVFVHLGILIKIPYVFISLKFFSTKVDFSVRLEEISAIHNFFFELVSVKISRKSLQKKP